MAQNRFKSCGYKPVSKPYFFLPVSVILLRQQRTKTVEQIFHQFKFFLKKKKTYPLSYKVERFFQAKDLGNWQTVVILLFQESFYCLSVVLGCFLDQLPSPRGEEIRNRYKVEVRFYLSICMNQWNDWVLNFKEALA